MIIDHDQLERLIRDAGQAWMLDFWPGAQSAASHLRDSLDQAYAAHARRFADAPVRERFDDEILLEEQRQNPHKVVAFFQALGATSSPDMLVMVWRILQGDAIKAADMHYVYEQTFRLHVEIENPVTRFATTYDSQDIDDAALLRHWGVLKMDGRPIFDGFEPLPS